MRLPERIVAFCLPGIGDAILFTPALAALRRAFPRARITLVTMFPGTADILETNPDVDEVRRFDFMKAGAWASLRYVRALRRERFDLSIFPFPANRLGYNVVNALVGRRWRAAHRYHHQSWRNLWFLNNIVVRETGTRHNLAEDLALVGAICRHIGVAMPAVDTTLRLRLTAADLARAAALRAECAIAEDAPLFGLHAYSSTFKNMQHKCWAPEKFVALIHRLGEHHPEARFLLFSGPADAAVNDHIMRHAGAGVVLVEEPNVRVALALLRECRLFVGNDSAIMHLAAAVGVPAVALFGPTDWRRLHPWGVRHRIARQALPCMPCFYYSSRALRCAAGLDYACMRELTVDDVMQAVQGLLAETAAPASVAGR